MKMIKENLQLFTNLLESLNIINPALTLRMRYNHNYITIVVFYYLLRFINFDNLYKLEIFENLIANLEYLLT
jgi:hypothetical protein